jgi:hypothetical protein
VYFENATELERIFGGWPSFHDAEILRASFDRSGDDGPRLELVIHAFQTTPEVDASGFFVRRNHTKVTLTFTKLAVSRFRLFNRQNVLSSIQVKPILAAQHEGRRLRVDLQSSYGLEATFECEQAIVSGSEPYEPTV